jgi:hypothetical protein
MSPTFPAKPSVQPQLRLKQIVILHTTVYYVEPGKSAANRNYKKSYSTLEIDSDIMVFDEGDHLSPPIRPPDGIEWQSIPVQDLHIEDEISGNIGLTFPRINGTSPFIRLPHATLLDIISHDVNVNYFVEFHSAAVTAKGSSLTRIRQSHICMCWSTALKKLKDCPRSSSLHGCITTQSLGKIGVDDEMCR